MMQDNKKIIEAGSAEENNLRSVIRESIKLYAKKKQMLSAQNLQEEKLRQVIRKILLSEKESKDPAPGSTLEGIMRSLLNNIIPQIRLDYIKLQTNEEERQGFKDYFYNAVENIIELSHDQGNEETEELEEQETLTLKSDDPDFISGVEDGTEPEGKDEEAAAPEEKNKDISSYFERGQNFGETAFGAIKDRIQNVVAAQIVPEEYNDFVKVLNANLQAWFKIWDQNRPSDQGTPEIPPTDTPVDQGVEAETEQDLLPNEVSPEEPAPAEEIPAEEPAPEELAEDFEIELE